MFSLISSKQIIMLKKKKKVRNFDVVLKVFKTLFWYTYMPFS